jgi:hypothetical protein
MVERSPVGATWRADLNRSRFTTTAYRLPDVRVQLLELRYDADFWPEVDSASDAVALAEKVRAMVARVLPEASFVGR